jgi:hypothetical protein
MRDAVGQFTIIDYPPAVFTVADFPQLHVAGDFGINARGDIVGVYKDTSNIAHGFLLKVEERDRDEEH